MFIATFLVALIAFLTAWLAMGLAIHAHYRIDENENARQSEED